MKLDRNDKDYIMKLGVFLWLHNRRMWDINGHFKMHGIYMSDDSLRVKLHRYMDRLKYQDFVDILKMVDLPPEFVNTKLILANKNIYPQENT